MRISDWSSDVCSSDLRFQARDRQHQSANWWCHRSDAGHRQQGEPVQHAELRVRGGGRWRRVAKGRRGRRSYLPVDRYVCRRFSDWAKSRRGCGNGGERSSTINSNTDPALAAMTPGPKNYAWDRSEEHTSELQSLMRISYAVFCLKKKT